jgi:hypothetical protein
MELLAQPVPQGRPGTETPAFPSALAGKSTTHPLATVNAIKASSGLARNVSLAHLGKFGIPKLTSVDASLDGTGTATPAFSVPEASIGMPTPTAASALKALSGMEMLV